MAKNNSTPPIPAEPLLKGLSLAPIRAGYSPTNGGCWTLFRDCGMTVTPRNLGRLVDDGYTQLVVQIGARTVTIDAAIARAIFDCELQLFATRSNVSVIHIPVGV